MNYQDFSARLVLIRKRFAQPTQALMRSLERVCITCGHKVSAGTIFQPARRPATTNITVQTQFRLSRCLSRHEAAGVDPITAGEGADLLEKRGWDSPARDDVLDHLVSAWLRHSDKSRRRRRDRIASQCAS